MYDITNILHEFLIKSNIIKLYSISPNFQLNLVDLN